MIEAENETHISASPRAVWHVLTDFARYVDWHPTLPLDGTPEVGGKITYGLKSNRFGPDARVRLLITRLEPEQILEWRFVGVPLLLGFTESFALSPTAGGTRLVHWIRYRGLGALFGRARAKVRAHAALTRADLALSRHLAQSSQVAQSSKALRMRRPKPRGSKPPR